MPEFRAEADSAGVGKEADWPAICRFAFGVGSPGRSSSVSRPAALDWNHAGYRMRKLFLEDNQATPREVDSADNPAQAFRGTEVGKSRLHAGDRAV